MLQKLKEPKATMSQEHRVPGWRTVVESYLDFAR